MKRQRPHKLPFNTEVTSQRVLRSFIHALQIQERNTRKPAEGKVTLPLTYGDITLEMRDGYLWVVDIAPTSNLAMGVVEPGEWISMLSGRTRASDVFDGWGKSTGETVILYDREGFLIPAVVIKSNPEIMTVGYDHDVTATAVRDTDGMFKIVDDY